MRTALLWFLRWLGLTLGGILAGGLLGTLLFPVFGTLLGMDLSIGEMARHGFHDGAFYLTIWAPGGCFILCAMWAHRRRQVCQDNSAPLVDPAERVVGGGDDPQRCHRDPVCLRKNPPSRE